MFLKLILNIVPFNLGGIMRKHTCSGVLTTLFGVFVAVLALSQALAAQTISSFPYAPTASEMASDFGVNSGSGPPPAGSSFSHGTISLNRRGENGSGTNSWACQPTSN